VEDINILSTMIKMVLNNKREAPTGIYYFSLMPE
jgi:hypothetical protein